jgi:hypothetical protein
MCLHVAAEARGSAPRRAAASAWGAAGLPYASVASLAASAMPLAGSLLVRAAALGGGEGEWSATAGARSGTAFSASPCGPQEQGRAAG